MTIREYWRIRQAIYEERNRDKVNAKRRDWYARNRGKVLAQQAQRRSHRQLNHP